MDLQVVHVRVNDEATGQPTPVRIRFVDSTGRYHAPLGRLRQFPTGFGQHLGGNVLVDRKQYAYIDGACEILLPSGPIQIEVHKGLEYEPRFHTFDRAPGQISLRLAIRRKFNLQAEGWYAGDVRAHFLSPQAAWLEGAAEGLHVVNLLAAEWEDDLGNPYHSNLLDFTGQVEPHKKDGTLVAVNTLNRGGPHNDFILLSCHRIVHPLRLGSAEFEHYTPNDWFKQCHRKGGLVVSPRVILLDDIKEIDAFAWLPDVEFGRVLLPGWYEQLDAESGRHVALVGGSGKASNDRLLGSIRTYVRIPNSSEWNYRSWCDGIRAGRTVATRGPLIDMSLTAGKVASVRATARCVTPYGKLELVCNGDVIASAMPNHDNLAQLSLDPPLKPGSWLAARCWGTSGDLLAHTSPQCVKE
jgi:hypothetical protein